MEDYDGFILFIVGTVLVVALFMVSVSFLKKVFNAQPEIQSMQSDESKRTQQERMQEVKKKEKELRELQKQRLRDYQNK